MEYLHFIFDGVSSKKYNLIIQNRGEDLSYASQPSFENKTASPLYQGTSYLLGVNKKEKTFSFNCWVNSLKLESMRELISWLSVDKVGYLILDYNPNFRHMVKVNSISDMKHLPVNEDGTVNYEFTLNFITIGSGVAESIQTLSYLKDNLNLVTNTPFGNNLDNGGPILFTEGGVPKIINYYTNDFPISIDFTDTEAVKVELNGETHYNYTAGSPQDININSEFGLVKIGNQLAEAINGVDALENKGSLTIPSGDSQTIYTTDYTISGNNITISDPLGVINYQSLDNLYIIIQDGTHYEYIPPFFSDFEREDFILNRNLTTNRLTFTSGAYIDYNTDWGVLQIHNTDGTVSALDEKANLVHTHPISEVTNLQTALNGKANSVHTHPISEVVNLQTSLNGKVDKLMATNLVTNGDFSLDSNADGLADSFTISTGSTVTDSVISNVQRIDVVAHNNSFLILSNGNIPSATDIMYLSCFVRTNLSNVRISIGNTSTANSVPTTEIWGRYSFRGSRGNRNAFEIIATSYSTGYVETKYWTALNLTQIFGAGNEPTREQMDRLLSIYPNSWFNGTSEIGSIGALMRASLGVQVVTPTLLNSRTGTAQYVVSNDGLVIFRGTASGGSLNTNIFVLPDNIRPAATRTFPISANNAFGVITVAANGEVRQTVGALTNVFLDGIVFNVGV